MLCGQLSLEPQRFKILKLLSSQGNIINLSPSCTKARHRKNVVVSSFLKATLSIAVLSSSSSSSGKNKILRPSQRKAKSPIKFVRPPERASSGRLISSSRRLNSILFFCKETSAVPMTLWAIAVKIQSASVSEMLIRGGARNRSECCTAPFDNSILQRKRCEDVKRHSIVTTAKVCHCRCCTYLGILMVSIDLLTRSLIVCVRLG